MRKICQFLIFSFLFIFVFNIGVFGTIEVYTNYTYSNLNFSICTNHGYINELTLLKYKGFSTLLNEYIKDLIQKKKLKNKKFEIQIGCKIFGGYPEISISRNKKGYHVFIHFLPDKDYILKVINYFASKNWQSFVYDHMKIKSYKAKKTFNKKIEKIDISYALDFMNGRKVKVWELDTIRIYYFNHKLELNLDGRQFNKSFHRPLPTQIKDRFIISSDNKILVLGDSKIVSDQNIPGNLHKDITFKIHFRSFRSWVNLYHNEKPVLSYSYDKNKFFILNKEYISQWSTNN